MEISEGPLAEQLIEKLGHFHVQIGRYISKNRVQSSDANSFVCGHGHVMFHALCQGG